MNGSQSPDLFSELELSGQSVLGLVEQVAQKRGRPIVLQPWRMGDAAQYGVWLAGPARDYIFFEAETARVHQEHIILHELAHILLGHETLRVSADNPITSAVLMRAVSNLADTDRERAAESLAARLRNTLIERAGLESLTRHLATAPLWSQMITGLGLDQ